MWGREDRITPFVQLEDAVATIPGAEVLVVDKAGHAAQYERPEVVNPAVVEFLKTGVRAGGREGGRAAKGEQASGMSRTDR